MHGAWSMKDLQAFRLARQLRLCCPVVQAQTFQQTGRQLRSKMWWQNMKMKLALAALVIIIIFVIFLIVCFSGRNCFK